MDDLVKLSILDEVDTQCLLSLTSYNSMIELIDHPDTMQLKEVWKHLQVFLAHSGILGSLIFKEGNPSRTKLITDFLKTELKIKESSPIKERGGRNFLEHIEVFEIYASNRKDSKGILQMVFPNRRGLEYMGLDRYYIKRALLKEELIFLYQNQEAIKELPLEPIYKEVFRIFSEVEIARKSLSLL